MAIEAETEEYDNGDEGEGDKDDTEDGSEGDAEWKRAKSEAPKRRHQLAHGGSALRYTLFSSAPSPWLPQSIAAS